MVNVLSLDVPVTVGQCATLACLWEAIAPKPGNVHPRADFEDMTFADLATSAVLIGPAMDAAARQPLGQTVLDAVRATRQGVGKNTNLGTILLLAPLATVPPEEPLVPGVKRVLARLGPSDAENVYRAIRLAEPAGLGSVDAYDVFQQPPESLREAMGTAADRDMVARQYAEDFAQVLGVVAPWLREGLAEGWPLPEVIVYVQMRLMARFPDSLIARKCGHEEARRISAWATDVLASGRPGDPAYAAALAELDSYLRSDGHRRNPGTTADLLAAGLFTILRDKHETGKVREADSERGIRATPGLSPLREAQENPFG